MPFHRPGLLVVVALLAAFGLSGCLSNPLANLTKGSGAEAAEPSPVTPPDTSGIAKRQRATDAAAAAMGARVVDVKGGYVLCSLIDNYKMCDGRPCRKDGLTKTTYYVCYPERCTSQQIRTPDVAPFKSLKSCVAACRNAERAARAKKNRSETSYCSH
jgi:hypothetical protein